MKTKLNSVYVDDQDKALKFYCEILGFIKIKDIPMGEFRWITVGSKEDLNGCELVLEPNSNPASKTYQEALFRQGIPLTAFAVDNLKEEYLRLRNAGVLFTMEPMEADQVIMAIFNDTCGNLIQIYQEITS